MMMVVMLVMMMVVMIVIMVIMMMMVVAFFFSFAGDYTGRPVVAMNETVFRRSPMVLFSLLCVVVASGQKSLLSR